MSNSPTAKRIDAIAGTMTGFLQYLDTYNRKVANPAVANFAFGNPHDMPLPAFVQAVQHHIEPQNKDWFAYKMNEPASQKIVAESLRKSHNLPFEPQDISMTDGGFAALAVALRLVVDPGDEVIFITPPWFFYEALIVDVGAVPVRVKVNPDTFDLDLNAIEQAITAKTRAIIVNSPNNPTGKIYPPETLQALAALLTRASEHNQRTLYLLSDEAYRQIVYEEHPYYSPAAYYPNTFVLYTYGKTLLTPGQRIGYIALPPTMPNRPAINNALLITQVSSGWVFPNALLQHSLHELEHIRIDIPHLQHKRDRMVKALREIGYDVHSPEGTFYLLPRSPLADDVAFCDLLAEQQILCLPGKIVEMPGYFRISLTANDAMIERSLAGFKAAYQAAHQKALP